MQKSNKRAAIIFALTATMGTINTANAQPTAPTPPPPQNGSSWQLVMQLSNPVASPAKDTYTLDVSYATVIRQTNFAPALMTDYFVGSALTLAQDPAPTQTVTISCQAFEAFQYGQTLNIITSYSAPMNPDIAAPHLADFGTIAPPNALLPQNAFAWANRVIDYLKQPAELRADLPNDRTVTQRYSHLERNTRFCP